MAKYVILAPAKACVGLPYGVSVNILAQPEDPVDVEIKIIDASSKKVKMETKLESLALGKAKAASFGIVPKYLARSDNVLSVKGVTKSGTIVFENSHPLKLRTDSLSIFIQTDKAIYKAGDLIRFRVIVTKEDLTPFNGFANVQIKSANGAVMEQFKGLSLNKGVARGELQLSNDPPLGDWSIVVNVESEDKSVLQDERTKKFEVEKFVLPKFVVNLSHPSYSTPGKDICITVRSKYTYGSGVPGIAHVTMGQDDIGKYMEKSLKLNDAGTVDVVFDYESVKDRCFTSDILKINVTVEEESTAMGFDATGEIIMYKDDKKLIIVKQGDFFKPGMDFTFTVSAVTMDGKPLISDSNITIGYDVTYFVEGKEKNEKGTISLEKDGRNNIVLKTPQKATELNFKAYFKGSQSKECPATYESVNVKASTSKTNSFIQIGSEHCTAVKVGDVVPFIITKSGKFSLQSLTLQVISKGSIVFVAEDNSSNENITINIPITLNMAPKSRLVAYAIRSDSGEVLVDAVAIHVNGLIRNDVAISIDPVKIRPCSDDGVKNEVTVTVKADSESFIGILGVDQSVLLPKSGNDITYSEVEKAIEGYDIVPKTVTFKDGFIYGVGGKYAKEVITNSGLLIFTNASVDENPNPLDSGAIDPCSNKEVTPTAKPGGVKIHPAVPETWIWFNSITRNDGKVEYKAQVPHTASSFIVSAFAIHPRTGLGIAPTPAEVEVFSPIFVSLNLPYFIKKGEKFAFQPLISNNGDSDQGVAVTLEHNKESGFDIIKNSEENEMKEEKYNQRKVQVKAARSETATFTIVPTVVGHFKLLVKAVGQTATDGAEASLLVKPEGVCVYFNRPLILDFTRGNRGSFESTIDMMPPAEIQKKLVDDSESIEFSVIGDVMGPILSGLDNLIRMPCGCGEQNVITMMQNTIVLKYLVATGEDRKHPQLIPKARMNIEIGYQRQLSYMHQDGSFSVFGENDENGSTWLTAYVIRSFFDAKDYIFVDPEILFRAISWLSERQKPNGEYEENGRFIAGMQGDMEATQVKLESNRMKKAAARIRRVWRNIKSVFHKDGREDHGVLITAFVLIALIRAGQQNEKAIEYLENNVERNRSRPYVASVTAYALGLAKSAKFSRALDILTESAINQGGERHWFTECAKDSTGADLWQGGPEPFDVETTSYALLSYLLVNRLNDAIPCMRWLSAHRNSLGGFASTQDTVVGIWALSRYARMVGKRTDISIDVTQGNRKKNFKLNDQNRIVLQREKLDALLQPVKIVASGNGMALAQVSWHYNVQNLSESKPFECNAYLFFFPSGKMFKLGIELRYNLKGRSNMTLMEVEVPSGYEVDSEEVNNLYRMTPYLKRVECTMSDTLVSIYFDELHPFHCSLGLLMLKLFDVQDQKPSQIRVVDYYQPHKTLHMEYSIANARAGEWLMVNEIQY